MKALRNYLDKIKPNFEEGGKLHAFRSVFDGKFLGDVSDVHLFAKRS